MTISKISTSLLLLLITYACGENDSDTISSHKKNTSVLLKRMLPPSISPIVVTKGDPGHLNE